MSWQARKKSYSSCGVNHILAHAKCLVIMIRVKYRQAHNAGDLAALIFCFPMELMTHSVPHSVLSISSCCCCCYSNFIDLWVIMCMCFFMLQCEAVFWLLRRGQQKHSSSSIILASNCHSVTTSIIILCFIMIRNY